MLKEKIFRLPTMPTRTEIVISIGEVLECLPPGKTFQRKRYNSFDANIGNEENLAPGFEPNKAHDMKQRSKVENEGLLSKPTKNYVEDEEISFKKEPVRDGTPDTDKNKGKRKTADERFLEDNANYFQLEVLSTKTRSNKFSDGFAGSFLDFLKHKDELKKPEDVPEGRSRHKSADSEIERSGSESRRRSRSSSRFSRSASSGRNVKGRARSKSAGRKVKQEKNVEVKEKCDLSPGAASDVSSMASTVKPSVKQESSPCESEVEEKPVIEPRPRRSKAAVINMRELSISESDAESIAPLPVRKAPAKKNVLPSEPSSEIEESEDDKSVRSSSNLGSPVLPKNVRKIQYTPSEISTDLESEDEKAESNETKRRHFKRSDLDVLRDAVDKSIKSKSTPKKISDAALKPLEIDCSDTGSETSSNFSLKRKLSETEKDIQAGTKKSKGSNNLLKTASPGGEKLETESVLDLNSSWDGWDSLNKQLEEIDSTPVPIDDLNFSFEKEPRREGWYVTYQRQDRGDEMVYYPNATQVPFLLPYQMSYSSFMPPKLNKKGDTDVSRPESKASSPSRTVGKSPSKKSKRKVSECESTDSEDLRKSKAKGNKIGNKIGAKSSLLMELNYRVSPRCHASTKSIQHGDIPGELDDLAEAYLLQDESELHFPNLFPFSNIEENSNDSHSSGSSKSKLKVESYSELSYLAANLDSFLSKDIVSDSDSTSKVKPKGEPSRPSKSNKKKKVDVEESTSSEDNGLEFDAVLLGSVENETGASECGGLDVLDMMATYSSCTSMSKCNSRWLKPTQRSVPDPLPVTSSSSRKEESSVANTKAAVAKKVPSPSKPKRIIIYKEDLPGFSLDSDMETEKLPVSKRVLNKAKADTTPPKESKKSDKTDEINKPIDEPEETSKCDNSDDDAESVDSAASTSPSAKKKRKTNKTGFPSPKKKKKKEASPQSSPKSAQEIKKTSPQKSDSPKAEVDNKSKIKPKPGSKPLTKVVSSKVKKDLFITKKTEKKPSRTTELPASNSRRTEALKAKNYSELSDTESLFEAGAASPSVSTNPSPAPSQQKLQKSNKKK